MKHPIFMCICLLCVLFALAGCQARTAMPLDTSEESASSTDDSERTENTNDSTLTRDGEQITIRSLADWEEFNYDGNFSDNCLLFLSHLIGEGSDFMEFDTVKISDYTIVRDPKAYEQYQLYFEFTVSESQLDTLPKGAYRTLVSDTVDCFVEFLDEDPRAGHPKAELPESGERFYQMLQTWIYSAYGWDCPAYGETTDLALLCNFICRQYGNSSELAFEEFLRLAKEKFGAVPTEASLSELESLTYLQDGVRMIQSSALGGVCRYAVTGYKNENGVHYLTVQYYAECNAFIPSYLVEYKITDDEKWLGYEILSNSPYKPYGLHARFS